MRIAVIGTGLVGHHIVQLLAAQRETEVVAIDRDTQALASLAELENVSTHAADVLAPGALEAVLASRPPGAIVTAVPGHLGYATIQAALALKVPIVDIAFMPEAPWGLDEPAKAAGVPVVLDCGLAPGLSNLCAGHGAAQLAEPQRLRILVGGLPAERRLPFEYISVFSPGDVIEEYTRPARLVVGGRVVERPALSDVEHHEFPGIGTLESFNTDGLRTLIESLNLPFMQEKTLRYPGHAERMRLLRETGFFSLEPLEVRDAAGSSVAIRPRELTLKLLEQSWRRKPSEAEFSLMMVELGGLDGEGRTKQWTYLLLDRTAPDGVTSMARTTATPAAIMAMRIAQGGTPANLPGIHMLETLASDDALFQEIIEDLARVGIQLHHELADSSS